MMKHTVKILDTIIIEFNNNAMIQILVDSMRGIAVKENRNQDKWNNEKRRMVEMMFWKLVAEHEDIRSMIVEDILNS